MKHKTTFVSLCILCAVFVSAGCTRTEIRYVEPTNPSTTSIAAVTEITPAVSAAWDEISHQSAKYESSELYVRGSSIIGLGVRSGDDCFSFPSVQGVFDLYLWDVNTFVLKSSVPVDGAAEQIIFGPLLRTFDLTGDDIPEVILATRCVEPLVTVYSVGVEETILLTAANFFEDGVLRRYNETCEPRCAGGIVEQYQLTWNGRSFDEVLLSRGLPDVAYTDYAGQDLSMYNMSEWDWTGADLNGSNLRGANLANSNLSGVNLSEADLTGANLAGANLSNAKLWDANLSNANLRGVDLRGASNFFTNFGGVDFLNANITGVNFESSNLTGATMPDGSLFVPPPDYDPMADGCDGDC